jgi:RNA polymerase sigma factor (sigma-70 family)
MDFSDLIERLRRGDRSAWQELYLEFEDLLFTTALRIVKNRDDASDIAYGVIARLPERLPGLQDPTRLPRYLRNWAAHDAVSLLRRAGREAPLATPGEPDGDGRVLPELVLLPDIEEQIDAAMKEYYVRAACEQLDPLCRELLRRLFPPDGPEDYETIAREMDLAVGSIGPYRGRCLEKLKRILESWGFFEEFGDRSEPDDTGA